MDSSIKIAIISHALVIPVFQNRWKQLAKDKNYELHLLIPKHWEQTWFSEKVVYCTDEVHDDNYHIHPMPTTSKKNWVRYFFKSIDAKFRKIKPDIIYIIHEESILIHHQIYLYKKIFVPKAKVIFFSMNAMGIPYQKSTNPIKKLVLKWMWNNIKNNTDAALVHYPGCIESLRSGKYNKPIYLQTQVGVDETIFIQNPEKRIEYRQKLGLEGKFIIGFSGRLTVDKGVDDLVDVFIKLSRKYDDIALLLVGNGDLRGAIEKTIRDNSLEHRVKITGFVDQAEVPAYMNAMDTFVLGSKTMPHWIDTFPLVTVQAQAVKVPVIASNSASIPWQLGDTAKLYQEGNKDELMQALELFICNDDLRTEYAEIGQNRSHEYFCHVGMTENYKKIIDQVIKHEFIYHDKQEKYTQWKAY